MKLTEHPIVVSRALADRQLQDHTDKQIGAITRHLAASPGGLSTFVREVLRTLPVVAAARRPTIASTGFSLTRTGNAPDMYWQQAEIYHFSLLAGPLGNRVTGTPLAKFLLDYCQGLMCQADGKRRSFTATYAEVILLGARVATCVINVGHITRMKHASEFEEFAWHAHEEINRRITGEDWMPLDTKSLRTIVRGLKASCLLPGDVKPTIGAREIVELLERHMRDRIVAIDCHFDMQTCFVSLLRRHFDCTPLAKQIREIGAAIDKAQGVASLWFNYYRQRYEWKLQLEGDMTRFAFYDKLNEFTRRYSGLVFVELSCTGSNVRTIALPTSIAAEFGIHQIVDRANSEQLTV